MEERRSQSRQKSFLQGRIYFNNRRSSLDCLVRDYSETGARLKFSDAVSVPEFMELYLPNREEMHRARIEWRTGNELGVSFGEEMHAPSIAADAAQGDLATRVQRLEVEVAGLKRMMSELRSEQRKAHGEVG